MDNWTDALGGFGPGEKLTALGKEWTFIFDVPLMMANAEAACLKWGREELKAILESYPNRNDPNSLDAALAIEEHRSFTRRVHEGSFRKRNESFGEDGKPLPGSETPPVGVDYDRWIQTQEGKVGLIAAALQVRHPDATYMTVIRMFAHEPVQMNAILDAMGKAIGEWGRRLASSQTKPLTNLEKSQPQSP